MFQEKSNNFRVGQWGDFAGYNDFRFRGGGVTAFLGLKELLVLVHHPVSRNEFAQLMVTLYSMYTIFQSNCRGFPRNPLYTIICTNSFRDMGCTEILFKNYIICIKRSKTSSRVWDDLVILHYFPFSNRITGDTIIFFVKYIHICIYIF